MRVFLATFLIALLLGAFLGIAAAVRAQPAPQARQHLPAVRTAPASTVCDGLAPIHTDDTGDLDATLDASGRFLVAYQDRAHGSRIKVDQHVGAGLQPLAAPVALAAAPAFSPSGAKQGPMALVALPNGRVRMYYTQRTTEDEAQNSGPYGLWCVEF